MREEVATRIDAMDKFVRRIRERIEHFREWGKNERDFLTANAGEANQDITRLFAADFDEMEKFYADVLHLIKTPADCEVLSAEIVALANDEMKRNLKNAAKSSAALSAPSAALRIIPQLSSAESAKTSARKQP